MFFLTINNNKEIQWLEVVSKATGDAVSYTLILRPYDYDPNSAKEPSFASNVDANLNFYLFDCKSKKYYYLTQQQQQLIRYPLLVDEDKNIRILPGEILQQTQIWQVALTSNLGPVYPPNELEDRKGITNQCKLFITQLEEKKAEAIAIFDQRLATTINTKDLSNNSIAKSNTNIILTQDYIEKVKQLYKELKKALQHEPIRTNRISILVNLTVETPEKFCAIVIALLKDNCSPTELLTWGVLGKFFINYCSDILQIQTAYSCLTTLAADPEFTMLSLIEKVITLAKGHNIRERGFEKYALDGSECPHRVEVDPITKLTTTYSELPEQPKLSTLAIYLTATKDNIATLHHAFGNAFLAIALKVEYDFNFEALKPLLESLVYTPRSIEQIWAPAETNTNIALTQDYIEKVKQLYQTLKQALQHEAIRANRISILVNLTVEEPVPLLLRCL